MASSPDSVRVQRCSVPSLPGVDSMAAVCTDCRPKGNIDSEGKGRGKPRVRRNENENER